MGDEEPNEKGTIKAELLDAPDGLLFLFFRKFKVVGFKVFPLSSLRWWQTDVGATPCPGAVWAGKARE